MNGRARGIRRPLTLAVAAVTLATTLSGGTAYARQPTTKPTATTPAPAAQQKTVTLLTGDKVVVDQGSASVIPGKGRGHKSFRTVRSGERLLVIPSDVSSLIAAGKLDQRLFDVNALIKEGYDDASTTSIPVLISYAAGKKADLRGVATALPVINGAAVKVDKKQGAAFLRDLAPGARTFRTAAVDKVWLDGHRRLSLDKSVPQIGVPTAWQAGYTGKGVKIAVVDSGVDVTHPDLAGQIIAQSNFTEDANADDESGHGTHVASTIAGTGAASGGQYRGVAPDAKLLNAKACTADGGCPDSAILAALHWAAVEQQAHVVNLSLGAWDDGDQLDPLEQAVNTLTAQTGALFVIAAGNRGPGQGSVDSPGSAEAALTVGAVDGTDELAEFSGRGPRSGDSGLKPDVTAPGVDIVAAKAKHSSIGTPVGDSYLRLSGTSMATPHVAGAAALLVQQHQDWKAAELKAALKASAKPAASQTAYEQGAGRVDVARAIEQTVVAEPTGLAFGEVLWPHTDDKPVTKTLTYRNSGKSPVALQLTAELHRPDRTPAPAGTLTLSTTQLTVPAGGRAAVEVTSDTRITGPDGLYSGRITATAAGHQVVTPVAVEREVESYDVTLTAIGPDGRPARVARASLVGIDVLDGPEADLGNGPVRLRVPRGEYLVNGLIEVAKGEDRKDGYQLVQPSLLVDRPRQVTLDARRSRPVSTTVPRAAARTLTVGIGFHRFRKVGPAYESAITTDDFTGRFVGQVGAAAPAGQLNGFVTSGWAVPGPAADFRNSPVRYNLMDHRPGWFPNGYHREVLDNSLARTTAQYGLHKAGRTGLVFQFARYPGQTFIFTKGIGYDLPASVTTFGDVGDVKIRTTFEEYDGSEVLRSELDSGYRSYRIRPHHREVWNAAFVPMFGAGSVAGRTGDRIELLAHLYSDRDGHLGDSYVDSGSTRLYRNGRLVGSSSYPGYLEPTQVQPGSALYQVVTTASRPTYSDFSTRTDVTWTFRSDTTHGTEPLPLRTVRYLPDVDARSTVKWTPVTKLPFRFDGQPGTTLPAPKKVAVQYSVDSGKTWRRAAVVRRPDAAIAIFPTPKGTPISLRAVVVDRDGSSVGQTVLDLYRTR